MKYNHESESLFEACNIDGAKFKKKMLSVAFELEKWEMENKMVPPFSVQIEVLEKNLTKREIALLVAKISLSNIKHQNPFSPEVA